MVVGIDVRFAGTHSGLGRYTRELTKKLVSRGDPLKYVLFVRSKNEEWLKGLPKDVTIFPAPFAHYSVDEQLHFPKLLRVSGIDLLLSPHFNVPLRSPVPFVVTIHDLILHRYPNQASLPRRLAYRFLMNRVMAKAERIITVSHFVADEIAATYGKKMSDRVEVVYEGVDDVYKPVLEAKAREALRACGVERPYLLYVGNAKQHKNVQTLLDAFARLKRSDLSLVLVTGGPESASLQLPPRAKLLHDVAEHHLPALYTMADCFVTASLYEGYGLPVVEALACGCPVIAADRGALNEIAKGRAFFANPTVESFTEAMNRLPSRKPPVVLGTWEEAAKKTATILLDLRTSKKIFPAAKH